MNTKPLYMQLEVAHVGQGGNTPDGQYFYSYKPDIVEATHSPTQLFIQFSTETGIEFAMTDLIASDGGTQLSAPVIATGGRSLEVTNANTTRQLILMDVLVEDTQRGKTIVCDPQMINRPS